VALGFALAGVPTQALEAPEAATRLEQLLRDPSAGVLLVEETLWQTLPEASRHAAANRPLPLVVPFPSPTWVPPEQAALGYVAEILRQAIGYRVKLR
jgi:vacuolar-type H+-ATPase subunit F/Vma7